jgi:hypothetical protein
VVAVQGALDGFFAGGVHHAGLGFR